jgi:hypothetical protein
MFKTCDWAILPRIITPACASSRKFCYTILKPCDIQLRADRVTDICTGIKIVSYAGYVIKINNHLCNKPWRSLVKFMPMNEPNQILTVPIVVSKNINTQSI